MSENPYQTPQHNPSTPAPITSENRYGPVRNLSALASFCKVMLGINIILVVAGLLVVYSSAYDQFVADALIGVLDEEGFYQQ